ncbi:hypothetical protein CKR_0962 [Clostridium kluyveri NBRC 12016]|uniref:Cell wall-binding repeat 2 family protein n=1 Tax=Clostridium kluyveri (strain NBRC 12016) TaxID=583346 RepID=B9E0I8_CLOK1|nr:hypothetical protein CKR_0962 [Clostridium kluyveri NBRC 12016]
MLAGKNEAPLVLLDNEVSESTADAIEYIKTNLTDSSKVEVLGGAGVIPENIVTKIKGYISSAGSETNPETSTTVQTFTGYIQDQDCFISYAPNYGDDTKMCLSMKSCAANGYGITALESDGSYKFYYFDGDFAAFADGKTFDGTGSQLSAWNLIQNTIKKNNITITVKGKLNGEIKTASDGNTYPVITVTSLAEN